MAPLDDKKTSEVQGSGRIIFSLAKILIDLIDDELTVSDAHKCAGKKVDMVGRALRVVTSAAGKVSVQGATLGCGQDDCEPPLSWFK